jgi:hypothetical protein
MTLKPVDLLAPPYGGQGCIFESGRGAIPGRVYTLSPHGVRRLRGIFPALSRSPSRRGIPLDSYCITRPLARLSR